MNKALRHVAFVSAVMFLLLFGSLTFVQFVQAGSLNSNPNNLRTLYTEYSKERGLILATGVPIASSVPVDNEYSFLREYPDSPIYSNITGYHSLVYGNSGIEKALNDELIGQTNNKINISEILSGNSGNGSSVDLTIDPDIQKISYEALGDMQGSVVVMDPKTGAILASVSKPSYDANLLSSHNRTLISQTWKTLNEDKTKPLMNRAIAGDLYAPGSTFKVLVAAAALESGKYDEKSILPGPVSITLPGTNVQLPNYGNVACSSNNLVTIARALEVSCNTAFATLGMELGNEAISEMAEAFGFSKELNIPLQVTPSVFPKNLNQPQLAQSAIGQFDVKATPLQMAMMSAAVFNEGVIMKPHLVKTVTSKDLKSISTTKPEQFAKPISTQTAQTLSKMMLGVVANGSAGSGKVAGVSVGGKTGTAERGEGQSPNALFTSFAYTDEKQIVVSVVVEDGGNLGQAATGEKVAVPIATKITEAVFKK